MIKILYVTREPFPSFRVDIKTLFGKYLPRFGVYASILSYQSLSSFGKDDWRGLNPITYRRKGNRILVPFYGILEILLILKYGKHYDIIQVRDKPFVGLFSLIIARFLRKEFVFWMSFPFPDADLQKGSLRKISLTKRIFLFLRGIGTGFVQYKILMKLAPNIVVQSEEMKRWLSKQKGISESKMFPVPMGIDMEEVKEPPEPGYSKDRLKKELGIDSEVVLCYAGQISEVRGMDLMFNVLKRLIKEKEDIHILLIGDAPGKDDRNYIERIKASPEFMGRITCTGWLPQSKVKEYLLICDIGLSILDNSVINYTRSPTKVMEYAAFGIPVIVSKIPDQQFVVEKTGCGISIPYDGEALYKALKRLIANEPIRKEYGKKGKLNIGKIRGYDKLAEKVAKYYRYILRK